MKVAELGEFGLINLIGDMVGRSLAGGKTPEELICGIGDDAAAWRCRGEVQLATVDSLVQGVHFTLDTISWEELGWKSLAVSLSDIAAMGGNARYALISLALPAETLVSELTGLYRGMLDLAQKTGVALVGGDTCRSPLVTITITIIGDAVGGKMLRRSGARAGDLVAVTGYLGSAAAGLVMLDEKLKLDKGVAAYLGEAFRRPSPRLAEGRLLVDFGVRAAMDISDGLVIDLGHIAEMSRVGARIRAERVPIEPRVKESFGARALELALAGGEDYELLFTASQATITRLKKALPVPVTVVGEIVPGEAGKVSVVDGRGRKLALARPGWEHFSA
ncbi:MAG: thiamine-phosphate kinase [Chloroflexota bacterium]